MTDRPTPTRPVAVRRHTISAVRADNQRGRGLNITNRPTTIRHVTVCRHTISAVQDDNQRGRGLNITYRPTVRRHTISAVQDDNQDPVAQSRVKSNPGLNFI